MNWPAWVQADWSNRYPHMTEYVTAVLQHWPQIQILGCWNEPSTFQVLSKPAGVLIPGTNWVTELQLMTEYHQLVTAIYKAKQSVNLDVKLNIGKFSNFTSYQGCMKQMKALGTWAMGDYCTWHDYDNMLYSPMVDTIRPSGGNVPSVAHKVAFALALFPGKMV